MNTEPIHFLDDGKMLDNGKVFAFISANNGEGTTTAILSVGQAANKHLNNRVLLVDVNHQNPDLHKRLNKQSNPGISDYLNNSDIDLGACIQEIHPSFHLLSIGSCPSEIPKCINANEFSVLIQEVRSEYNQVLIDSCPLVGSLPNIRMFKHLDGVVLVVECGKTRWEVAQFAKNYIEHNQAKLIGVILNKRNFHIPEWLYKIT